MLVSDRMLLKSVTHTTRESGGKTIYSVKTEYMDGDKYSFDTFNSHEVNDAYEQLRIDRIKGLSCR